MVKHRVGKKAAKTKEPARISIPKWLECTWRRVPCGKSSCPVCSVLNEEQAKMQERGEMEEFVVDTLDDLRYSIAEAFLVIVDTKKDFNHLRAHRHREEAVFAPRRFALYRKLDDWHEELHELFDEADQAESIWVESIDAADLDWYMHILLDYVHRLLTHRAGRSKKEANSSTATTYMRYVVTQVCAAIVERLNRLALLDSDEKVSFIMLLGRFAKQVKEVVVL